MADQQLAQDSTHELSLAVDDSQLVVKRYVSGAGSAEREWTALRLLQEYAPGLAPEPVSADPTADPAFVVMRRLPGEPLRGRHLTGACLDAVGAALERLHTCVPPQVLATMSPAGSDPATGGPKLRRRLDALPRPVDDPVVTAAYDHATAWFESAEATEVIGWQGRAAFARGDHNLSNFLLDDDRIVLVDFEYSGRGDRASELAELVEHISARATPDEDWNTFLSHCNLDAGERQRLAGVRRSLAIMWLLLLLPGQPGHERNPPGTLRQQAERLLNL